VAGHRLAPRNFTPFLMKFIKNTLLAGVPFGLFMAVFFAFMRPGPIGLAAGLIGGLFFGLIMAGFVAYQRRKTTAAKPVFPGEELLHDGPANHFRNGEGVGGWLYLTNRRLFFRSHPLNLQPHETDLPLGEIATAAPALTLGLIPNGLVVSTATGASERFVVEQRKSWSTAIAQARTVLAS